MDESLIGLPLDGYRIGLTYEVWISSEDGWGSRHPETDRVAFYDNREIADAIAANHRSGLGRVSRCMIITDGTDTILFEGERITVSSEDEAIASIREKALGKLTEAEQKLLGLWQTK